MDREADESRAEAQGEIELEAWIDESYQLDVRLAKKREEEDERREEIEAIRDPKDLAGIVRAGDPDLFTRVIEFYADDLTRLARSILRDDGDAASIVNEAWLRAWEAHDSLQGDDPKPWLSRIVQNLAFNHLRRGKRETPFSSLERARDADEEESDEISIVDRFADTRPPSPEEITTSAETVAAVREAIRRLPDRMQEVMKMLALEGKSVSETAEALGIREQTVRNYNARAREQLRKFLEGVER